MFISNPQKYVQCVGEAHGLEYSSGWYIYLPLSFKRLGSKSGYRYHKRTEAYRAYTLTNKCLIILCPWVPAS